MDEVDQRCATYVPQRNEHDFNNLSAAPRVPTITGVEAMIRLILVFSAIALVTSGAIAQQLPLASTHATSSKARPPTKNKACPEYGPGFVRVEGSNTCVKVGGYIRIEAGSGVQR